MDIIDRILNLGKENDMTANKITVTCGLQSNSFTHWKNRGQKPSLDALIKIADYFGVSLDYLVGRDNALPDVIKRPTPQIPTDIIEMWQKLTPSQQSEVRGFIKGVAKTKIEIAFEKGEISGRQKVKQQTSIKDAK